LTCVPLVRIEGINQLGRPVVGEHQAVAVARSCLHAGCRAQAPHTPARPVGDAQGSGLWNRLPMNSGAVAVIYCPSLAALRSRRRLRRRVRRSPRRAPALGAPPGARAVPARRHWLDHHVSRSTVQPPFLAPDSRSRSHGPDTYHEDGEHRSGLALSLPALQSPGAHNLGMGLAGSSWGSGREVPSRNSTHAVAPGRLIAVASHLRLYE
jgi:hypothetical protein